MVSLQVRKQENALSLIGKAKGNLQHITHMILTSVRFSTNPKLALHLIEGVTKVHLLVEKADQNQLKMEEE